MHTTRYTSHVNGTTANGTPHFDSYVCPGDTVTVEDGLYTFTARIERDDFIRLPEDEGFDLDDPDYGEQNKEIVEAWRNDEWFYCGIVISADYNGIELPDEYLASLWGIEANFPNSDNKYLAEVVDELLPEAKERALSLVEKMREALTEGRTLGEVLTGEVYA